MKEIILFLNHWWRENKVRKDLAKEYKREVFKKLTTLIKNRQAIVICGLRRVGKTTLMYQLIEFLIKKKVNPLNIIYFSFDKKTAGIKEILDTWSKITEKDYEKEKIYLFLDEIYKLEEWHKELKLLYDALPNIKFIVSGSASLKVEKEARKNLVGRAFYLELKPLSFKEFFELKFNTKLENIKIWENKLKNNFLAFLERPFPEVINFEKERVAEYIREMVLDKILFSDFPKSFERVDVDVLENLVEIFFSQPGMYLNIDSLSQDLKKSKNDLIFHINLLKLGYLIRIVKNYRGSYISASRKLKRIYPYHPALIQAIFKKVEDAKLVECFVRSHLEAELYWRKSQKEVDFVYKNIPIEVKYKEKITLKDMENLIAFMEIFKIKKGYLISKKDLKKIKVKNKTIQIIPVWYFALYQKEF